MPAFVHLHVHTEYSLREGALRIEDCIRRAVELGMPAVAVTDTNALYGAVKFYRAAKAAGIKPILGVQMHVSNAVDPAPGSREARQTAPFDLAVLLAEDYAGYQNLVRLVSLAHSRYRNPHVTFPELTRWSDRVIALVGGGESQILRAFAADQPQEALRWLTAWRDAWPTQSLYVDLQDHGIPEERRGLPDLLAWSHEFSVPVVATNDVHYLHPADADIQRVLAQLEGGLQSRPLQGDHYHFTTPDEMSTRFANLPQALENTLHIAARCTVELPSGRVLLPQYPTSSGESAAVVLRRAAEAGAKQRYSPMTEQVRARLDVELDVIERLGFADYFLVVADFIRFAHKSSISTGPGRGSVAGSLVAYALRITDVDPLKYKLLFERFLNPERVSWPDIDTDFEYERRSEVIQYVAQRYGADHVAQIGTFGTLAARAAIRDAGRALQIDPKLVDRLAKLIPSYAGVTLKQAYDEVAGISELVRANQHAAHLWQTASGLEGFPRHTSTHAAGVVISPLPLTDITPVLPGADGVPVTQYTMDDVEYLGLLKMDFLGLRTLTLIDACVASVEKSTGQPFDWRRTPEDDARTFAMLGKGDTNGCFQLESGGVRRVLRDLRPSTMEDLIAVISLYRPGPMENIPVFIAAKHGRAPIRYPHPDLAPILKDTYGVIVYQEQIMQIASRMAGFSLGQADVLRRAVSKKKRDELDAQRARFVAGCVDHGYSPQVAQEVYDLIVRFADYGFNRSHAAAYAVLAYRTAYLRANYLPHFLASLLSMTVGASDKSQDYLRDAKQYGVHVLPPSVSTSLALYEVADDMAIRPGLLAIRNVGRAGVDAVLSARAQAPFGSLVDFLKRVNPRVCNRKAVESLLAVGALNDFLPDGATPEAALQILEEAYAVAEEGRQTRGLGLVFEPAGQTRAGTVALRNADAQAGNEQPVLYIRWHKDVSRETISQMKQWLAANRGDVPVALYDTGTRKARLLEARYAVALTPELIAALEEIVGLGNARVGRWTQGTATLPDRP